MSVRVTDLRLVGLLAQVLTAALQLRQIQRQRLWQDWERSAANCRKQQDVLHVRLCLRD